MPSNRRTNSSRGRGRKPAASDRWSKPHELPRVHLDDTSIGPEERGRVFGAQEAFARDHLRFRFIREGSGNSPRIKLVGLALGEPMPFTRVIWSMWFANDAARDRMFAWLTLRLDRWADWGELVLDRGAQALTERLLQLMLAPE